MKPFSARTVASTSRPSQHCRI